METIDPTCYTESYLSDLLYMFFSRFKKKNSYKYVDMIDSNIISSQVIEIDYSDFTDDIKNMLKNQTEERIHTAIYRKTDHCYLEDGSTKVQNKPSVEHTFLNDKDITGKGKIQLSTDDVLKISDIEIRISVN